MPNYNVDDILEEVKRKRARETAYGPQGAPRQPAPPPEEYGGRPPERYAPEPPPAYAAPRYEPPRRREPPPDYGYEPPRESAYPPPRNYGYEEPPRRRGDDYPPEYACPPARDDYPPERADYPPARGYARRPEPEREDYPPRYPREDYAPPRRETYPPRAVRGYDYEGAPYPPARRAPESWSRQPETYDEFRARYAEQPAPQQPRRARQAAAPEPPMPPPVAPPPSVTRRTHKPSMDELMQNFGEGVGLGKGVDPDKPRAPARRAPIVGRPEPAPAQDYPQPAYTPPAAPFAQSGVGSFSFNFTPPAPQQYAAPPSGPQQGYAPSAQPYLPPAAQRPAEDYAAARPAENIAPFAPRGYAPPAPYRPAEDYAPPAPYRPAEDYAPPAPQRSAEDYAPPAPYRPAEDYAPPAPYRPAEDYAPPAPQRSAEDYAPPAPQRSAEDYAPPAPYRPAEDYGAFSPSAFGAPEPAPPPEKPPVRDIPDPSFQNFADPSARVMPEPTAQDIPDPFARDSAEPPARDALEPQEKPAEDFYAYTPPEGLTEKPFFGLSKFSTTGFHTSELESAAGQESSASAGFGGFEGGEDAPASTVLPDPFAQAGEAPAPADGAPAFPEGDTAFDARPPAFAPPPAGAPEQPGFTPEEPFEMPFGDMAPPERPDDTRRVSSQESEILHRATSSGPIPLLPEDTQDDIGTDESGRPAPVAPPQEERQQVLGEIRHGRIGLCVRIGLTAASFLTLLYFGLAYLLPGVPTFPFMFAEGDTMRAFLTVNLVILAATMLVNAPTVGGGLVGMCTLKADGDSLVSLAMLACVAQGVALIITPEAASFADGVHLYFCVPVLGLILNLVGKMMMMRRIALGSRVAYAEGDKFVMRTIKSEDFARELSRGIPADLPEITYSVRSETVGGFLPASYAQDYAENLNRVLVFICLAASALVAALSYFISDTRSIYVALSVFCALLCVCAPFTTTLVGNMPMLRAARALQKSGAAIAGYPVVEEYSAVKAVTFKAKELFPEDSITLGTMKVFQESRIEQAILDAASVICATDSPLAPIFKSMINANDKILKTVDNIVYEDGMGLSAWVDGKRVLIGNALLMHNHNINTPSKDYEARYVGEGKEILYLSNSGELTALFALSYTADHRVAAQMRELAAGGVSLIVHTTDPNVTAGRIASLFGYPEQYVKLVPANLHADYDRVIAPRGRAHASIIYTGTIMAMFRALGMIPRIKASVTAGTACQLLEMLIGYAVVTFFAFFAGMTNVPFFFLIIYQALFAAATAVVSNLRKI